MSNEKPGEKDPDEELLPLPDRPPPPPPPSIAPDVPDEAPERPSRPPADRPSGPGYRERRLVRRPTPLEQQKPEVVKDQRDSEPSPSTTPSCRRGGVSPRAIWSEMIIGDGR